MRLGTMRPATPSAPCLEPHHRRRPQAEQVRTAITWVLLPRIAGQEPYHHPEFVGRAVARLVASGLTPEKLGAQSLSDPRIDEGLGGLVLHDRVTDHVLMVTVVTLACQTPTRMS